tara:strand:- start:193 stop:759 length:567 start_codon:yes stop_codon:yes gene_type:complete
MVLEKMKKTKSYSYILPMLMEVVPGLKGSQRQLRNVFIGDEDYPYLDGHIFLLYGFTGERWFLEFEDIIRESSHHELTEDKDKLHVMMIFRVPDEHLQDYQLFKKSKFSEMSTDYKKQLKTFHALHDNHPIMDVLYKREKAYESLEERLNVRIPRDQEASSILNMDEECYKNDMRVKDPMKMNWDLKI